jgi:hypothetical protein
LKSIEDLSELGTSPGAIATRWLGEIEYAEKKWNKYKKRVEKLVKRYTDERENTLGDEPKKLNILWANVETIKPALYNQTPNAEVSRRNKDRNPLGREAAEVIERGLNYCIDAYDFDQAMKETVHDYVLGGFGTARIVYDPTIENEQLISETAKADYVHYTDFLTNDARKWGEVRWVGFRHFFTRAQLKKLSPQYGEKVTLDHSPEDLGKEEKSDLFKKAVVWEIWDKESSLVYYIAKSFDEAPILVREPFCKFREFFPMPRPLIGVTGNSIIPTPDYALYQDQAELIDELTNKIYALTKALKVAGVYNGKEKELAKILDGDTGNVMIPVDDWSGFQTSGGMQGSIQWLPVKEVADALLIAYQARQQAKQDLYEATGLSDILRGASDPNETATAQQIKNQWGSLRIRDRQKDVQRFARDLLRLKGEVIAERFSLQTLKEMSGVELLDNEQQQKQLQLVMQKQPPAQQVKSQELLQKPTWEQVYALLQNDRMRTFSIGIETDSTIEPDEMAEKQARTEFLAAMSGFIEQAGMIIAQAPETAPLMGEMLAFGVRGFRVGSELETTIETTMEQLQNRIANPAPPQPDPNEQAKLQAQKEKDGAQLQLEAKKHDDQMKLELIKLDHSKEIEGAKLKHAGEMDKHKADMESYKAESKKNPEAEPPSFSRKAREDQTSQKNEQLVGAIIQAIQGQTQATRELTQAVVKPKRVHRGPDGKAALIQ